MLALLGHAASLPSLAPVARSYASTDPAASARFFQNVVPGTKIVATNYSTGAPACDVDIVAVQLPLGAIVGGAGQMVYFVRDHVASDCGAAVKPFQELQTQDFINQNSGAIKYDQWGDNHDGYHFTSSFNVSAIVAGEYFTFESIQFPAWDSPKSALPLAALDVVVRNTTFNFQLWGNFTGSLGKLMPYKLDEWESCRNQSMSWVPDNSDDLFWWKSTFATSEPEREAHFVVEHLGAREVPPPFPVPYQDGCTRARWVAFDATGWMIHFVYSPEYYPKNASLTIASWESKVTAGRAITHGVYDTWMWNRVIFWADAGLDAFEKSLDSAGVAYTTRDWPVETTDGKITRSLLFSSSGGLVYEIRARVAASPAALWDVCKPAAR